jgi:magnesium chelatase family protein
LHLLEQDGDQVPEAHLTVPLLDRNDIHIEVPRVEYEKLSDARYGESRATVRLRVESARQRQCERFTNAELPNPISCSADMRPAEVRK